MGWQDFFMSSPSARQTGLLLPAFSARREGDLGMGDTRAMIDWIRWAAQHRIAFLQLLPINHTGSDDSPYNAISSVALEPLYLTLEVDEIPGLTQDALEETRKQLGADVLAARLVDYPRVRSAKLALLQKAYQGFLAGDFSAEKKELQQFREAEAAWLEDFSLFRWLMDQAGGSECWDQWSAAYRTAGYAREYFAQQCQAHGSAIEKQREFHIWVQWLCFRQWREVRRLADQLGVKLMGDIPIGISYHSADVFFQPEIFDLEWFGGAPPETMFKHDRFIQRWGQNWGIPLYRWDLMEQQGFPWWQQRIRKLTEIFPLFRIDHILGFYRIYAFPWRPTRNAEFLELTPEQARERTGGRLPQWAWRDDETAENRQANCADGDRRLRAILAAAGASEVIGEDLGCVPDYVRPHLTSLDIAGFRIPHWDHEDGAVITGDQFPECSFATYATHDHDTIAALWENFRLDAIGATAGSEEQRTAQWNLKMMADFAQIEIDPTNPPAFDFDIQWKLIDALLASRARYAALMITDLFGMIDRFNKPGTVGHENWSYRLPFTLWELKQDAAKQKHIAQLLRCIKTHDRLPASAPTFLGIG